MKNILFFVILISIQQFGYTQERDTIYLADCYKLVRANAPQLSLMALNEEKNKLEERKLTSQNLPQVSAFGKAWYQSDAISVAFPAPINTSIEVDQFQYNGALNIDQKLFDGGIVSVQKSLSEIQSQVSDFETECGLYKLNEIINKYFFGIITLQKTYEILELKQISLGERKKQVESGFKHGVVKASELDRIESEIALTYQQMIELELSVRKLESGLKILIAVPPEKEIFLKPPSELEVGDSLNRPEIKLFQLNRKYIEEVKKVQDKRYVPKVFAYGQLGYSYPGLNFFENEPAGFYMVGLKMSWNIFDWNMAKKEKQLLNVSIEKVNIQEQDFRRNLSIDIENLEMEILKLEEIIQADENVILTLAKVTKASTSALNNGTITTADYLNDLNAELKSRIDFEKHQLLKLEATANLALMKGIEVK